MSKMRQLKDFSNYLRAVAIILVAGSCAASAQTAAQQAPPSAAPQPAQPLTDFQETQFYGCWKHAGVRPVANQWTGDAILCFRKDRTVHYHYISPEHGEADLFEWRFIPDDKLVIDEQACDIWNGTTAEALFLGRCLYMGAWIRQCARMNDEGTGCPGDPAQTATRQAQPSATAQSPQPPVYSQESQFYGCWKRAKLQPITNQQAGFSILCFRNDRTAYYFFISTEHGGEDLFKWKFVSKDKLVIDEQSCRLMPGTNAENLLLGRCLHMGAWVRQCSHMNNEGTACPRNQ
jgi:hypothetical protein